MSELVVIFRAGSSIEVSIVRALLDSHGIESVRTSGPPASLFPFTVNPMGETSVAVRQEEAEEAVRVIESHREQVGGGLVVPLPQEFDALESRVAYRFKDRGLLEHALTHKSKAHEDPSGGVADNESLEFLGDAVLGLVVAETLFRSFPSYNEGQKSKIKANLVSTASLAELAEQMGLGDHMILGRGEEKTGGRRKQALLADTCEALIAAIYLDGGLEPARSFLMREFASGIDDAKRPDYFGRDHKSRLQERLQAQGRPLPAYRVSGEVGPDHRKMFHVEVFVGEDMIAQGMGRTKKEAEQEAARVALERLSTPNTQFPTSK
jgi:ribonuclease-3